MFPRIAVIVCVSLLSLGTPAASTPLVRPMQAAIAKYAADDEVLALFYRARGFAPVWMDMAGPAADVAMRRREAFLRALDRAGDHGLPVGRYDPDTIRAEFSSASGAAALGTLEVDMSRRFLRYATDMHSGILTPSRIDPTIRVEVPAHDDAGALAALADGDLPAFLAGLAPKSPAYDRLLREKLRLEDMATAGGWGVGVPDGTLRPGDAGRSVVALRDRLVRMGYLPASASAGFDDGLTSAVRAFQTDHGLTSDGEAGAATLAAVNVPLEDRLAQIVVGLERQRWMNRPLEPRHVLVNLAEQRAYVVDDGIVSFDTVVVVGADTPDRRTPEFSDTMSHMVINPTWNVPRSIAVNEYLPALRRGGARQLDIYYKGDRVDPARVDFSRFTAANFPFRLKQAPGAGNALGRVKFMFPNRWNIYLHDTPSRDLFSREVRTFSHGCVRVGKPLELAYHLLAPQTSTPQDDFTRILNTGRERRVDLDQPIGVHLVYWSAWVTPTGRVNYRGDPYGRDAAVLRALSEAGVELDPSRS